VWQSRKLTTKFSILMVIVFLMGAAIGGTALWQVLHGKAEAEVEARGAVLLETMNAVRGYTSTHVNPLLAVAATDNAGTEAQTAFHPEMVPAFAAREIFEQLREDEKFEGFFYKEASMNPTNLRDRADVFEGQLLAQMKRDGQSEYADFRMRENAEVYYIARPMRVTSEGCLACHGDPKDAPPGVVEIYGDENGFNWKLNDIIAAQIVYVPADEVLTAATRSFAIAAGGMIATLALVLIVVNVLLNRDILHPVGVLGGLARKLSADELDSADLASQQLSQVAGRNDELGQAARTFRQMASEVFARTQNLKQQVRELRIEIDEVKHSQQVADLVETDFFQDLQAKAKELRSQRKHDTDG
jgi:methyl-accepting chemotaxis protein